MDVTCIHFQLDNFVIFWVAHEIVLKFETSVDQKLFQGVPGLIAVNLDQVKKQLSTCNQSN